MRSFSLSHSLPSPSPLSRRSKSHRVQHQDMCLKRWRRRINTMTGPPAPTTDKLSHTAAKKSKSSLTRSIPPPRSAFVGIRLHHEKSMDSTDLHLSRRLLIEICLHFRKVDAFYSLHHLSLPSPSPSTVSKSNSFIFIFFT